MENITLRSMGGRPSSKYTTQYETIKMVAKVLHLQLCCSTRIMSFAARFLHFMLCRHQALYPAACSSASSQLRRICIVKSIVPYDWIVLRNSSLSRYLPSSIQTRNGLLHRDSVFSWCEVGWLTPWLQHITHGNAMTVLSIWSTWNWFILWAKSPHIVIFHCDVVRVWHLDDSSELVPVLIVNVCPTVYTMRSEYRMWKLYVTFQYRYWFGTRNSNHIIDLERGTPIIYYSSSSHNGTVLRYTEFTYTAYSIRVIMQYVVYSYRVRYDAVLCSMSHVHTVIGTTRYSAVRCFQYVVTRVW
jgi:hypothetical protein